MIDMNAFGGADKLKTLFGTPQGQEKLIEALAKRGPPPNIPTPAQLPVGAALASGQVAQPYPQSAVGAALGGGY